MRSRSQADTANSGSRPVPAPRGNGAGAGGERGSATVELALVLPAALLVLGVCLASIASIARFVMVSDATASTARLLGRGDPAATAVLDRFEGVTHSVRRDGDLVCVDAVADLGSALSVSIPVTTTSCAPGEGR